MNIGTNFVCSYLNRYDSFSSVRYQILQYSTVRFNSNDQNYYLACLATMQFLKQQLVTVYYQAYGAVSFTMLSNGTYKAHGAVVPVFVALCHKDLRMHARFVLLLVCCGLFLVGFTCFFSSTTAMLLDHRE